MNGFVEVEGAGRSYAELQWGVTCEYTYMCVCAEQAHVCMHMCESVFVDMCVPAR